MQNSGISKYTISFGLSLAIASVADGLLVIAKETNPDLLAAMKKLTGHHWVTHSIIILGIFFLFGWLFAQSRGGIGIKMSANRLIGTLVAGVAAGSLILLGLFTCLR